MKIGFWTWWAPITTSVLFFPVINPYVNPKIIVLAAPLLWLLMRGHTRSLDWRAWVLILWPLVTFVWSGDPSGYVAGLGLWALCTAAYTVHLDSTAHAQIRAGLAWSCIPITSIILAQRIFWEGLAFEGDMIPGALFGNANAAAQFLLLALCCGRWPQDRAWWRGFALVGIALTQSLGVWLAALIWALWQVRSAMRPAVVWALVAGTAGLSLVGLWRLDWRIIGDPHGYAAAFRAEAMWGDKAARDAFRGKSAGVANRVLLTGNSLAMTPQYAWFGAGMGQFHRLYPRYGSAWVSDVNLNDEYRVRSPHNLILDVILAFGLGWLLLLAWFLKNTWRDLAENDRVAWLLQLLLAMVSINYLQPLIAPFLLMLLPTKRTDRVWRGQALAVMTGLALIIFAVWSWMAANPRYAWPTELFAADLARIAYTDGRFDDSWRYQRQALDQDPYGPETLHNLGLVAQALSETSSDAWSTLARRAFELNQARHPNYAPSLEALGFGPDRPPKEPPPRQMRATREQAFAEALTAAGLIAD